MNLSKVVVFVSLIWASNAASATSFSEMGTLQDPQDWVTFTLQLKFTGSITLQTYGFGGGTNVALHSIPAGGFDPFVGLFAGTGPTAALIDGASDALSNYTSEPNACGPAGAVSVPGYGDQCGDVRLQFSGLAAGLYTVVLSDALFYPAAATEFPPELLGDGFDDNTAGSSTFQTCYDPSTCLTDSENWALDIVAPEESTLVTPEPASFGLTGLGLMCAGYLAFRRRMTSNPLGARQPTAHYTNLERN